MHIPTRSIRLALYWGLPPLILLLIFRQLDLSRLATLAAAASPVPVFGAVALIVLKIVAGAARWHQLANHYGCSGLPFRRSVTEYWASLAVGTLTPGTLGSDVYRVALGGRRTGRYGTGAFVIGIEKAVALVSCGLLIACTYPLVNFEHVSAPLVQAINAAYIVIITGTGMSILLARMERSRWLESLLATFGERVSYLSKAASKGADHPASPFTTAVRTPLELLRSALAPGLWVPAVSLSLGIHLMGAIQGQLFMHALGYDLPFIVNLFIAPLTILFLSLPITLAGLGVREAIFVVCYGAFGVPAEVALLVSLLFFAGTTAVQAVGAVFVHRQRPVHV